MSILSYLINGISLGSVYAIIALGYTMVYGIAKMLNFAHGDVIMVGGYVALTVMMNSGAHPVIAVLAAIVVCTVLGVVIERVAYRPLRNAASPLAVLITAIGVSYLLQNVACSDLRVTREELSVGYYSSGFKACRRFSCDHGRDDCYNCKLYCDYGLSANIYQ